MQRTGEALHKARLTQKNQAPKNGGPAGAKTITNANSTEGGQRNAAVLEGLQSWHVRSGTKRGRKGYLRFGHERSIRVHHDRQRLTLSAPTAPPKARRTHLSLVSGRKPRQSKNHPRKQFSSIPTSPVAGDALRRTLRGEFGVAKGAQQGLQHCAAVEKHRPIPHKRGRCTSSGAATQPQIIYKTRNFRST